ncbi:MAG: chaperonin GroEL [Chlamydiales bacterium]|nr:chaperonin GroEL [Chlamydiia bacterium]MCP5508403.1 chaperonin GroEL [Chlamydiales bacterium]
MSTPAKEIIFEEEARDLLFKGISKLADVVVCTLGPRGRNIGLEKSWGAPSITNDGSYIANEITLENTYENMGASMAKEVVKKIKEKCGDGTTTGTVLLRALVESGIKSISSGISPISLKRGMDKAVEAIVAEIEKNAKPIKDFDDLRNIAIVSASGNKEIGEMIANAIEKVGKSGVVTVEEGKGTETTVDLVEGMQFDRGYISAYFCTNPDKMTVEASHPAILLVDKKISNIHELLPILQSMATTGRQLIIIAEDIEGDALSTLVVNKIRGTLKVAAVKAPGFGDRRKAMLQDLAALTGATVVSEEAGITLNDVTPDNLGTAEKVTIAKDETTIVAVAETQDSVKSRIAQIEAEINASTNKYDIEKLEERKAKLSGGVAVIRVGAATEPEMKQKKQAFEDSLNSTRAAQEMGVGPGGGITLLRAAKAVASLKLEGEEAVGATMVSKACSAPLRQIAANAGFDGSVVVSELSDSDYTLGFNALSGKVEDMLSAGIIDPIKVVINALVHAASVAGIVLISEALIANAPEDEE